MPYIQPGAKICRPDEVKTINIGDLVVVNNVLIKSENALLQYPPLSLISDSCKRVIESPTWVDGYRIRGDEKIVVETSEKVKMKGKIKVEDPKILTAYVLQKLLPDELEIEVSRTCIDKEKGTKRYPVVSIDSAHLLTITKPFEIHICTDNSEIITYLKLLAYAIYYYISSSSDEL